MTAGRTYIFDETYRKWAMTSGEWRYGKHYYLPDEFRISLVYEEQRRRARTRLRLPGPAGRRLAGHPRRRRGGQGIWRLPAIRAGLRS